MTYTKTNYPVKVQLNADSPPTTDQIVIWDSGSEQFNLINRDRLSGAGCFSYNLSSTSQGSPGSGEITFNTDSTVYITSVTASVLTFNSEANWILNNLTTLQNAYFSFVDQNESGSTWIASNFSLAGSNIEFEVAFSSTSTSFVTGPGIAC